jgi:hypothetical protein
LIIHVKKGTFWFLIFGNQRCCSIHLGPGGLSGTCHVMKEGGTEQPDGFAHPFDRELSLQAIV